ncbi:MAG: hypothetical protein HDR01_10640 [Lachnospiraceae bacterium]|nr:hypothetical protein [Lachnospiraceae bacterium]
MNFIILASFILLGAVITRQLSKSDKNSKKAEEDFWNREREANSIRKKPLDDLNYIQIPYEKLPFHILTENQQVQDCMEQINSLSELKIVNLAEYTNTDLKLKYGTANITILSEYDQNFTLLVRTLYKWGRLLYEAGYEEEALIPLELAVFAGTDISGNYKLLASIYKKKGQISKIEDLKASAQSLTSIMKKPILTFLSDIVHTEK